MTLHPYPVPPVPDATAAATEAAFPKGNRYMRMRDELGVFFSDQDFAQLYPNCGHAAAAPWRLALITIMQFAENLSDRQAADAVDSICGRHCWNAAALHHGRARDRAGPGDLLRRARDAARQQ